MYRTLMGLALLGGVLLMGCESGSGGQPTVVATAAPTVTPYIQSDLSPEQLGSMTLALEEFGPRYAIFATQVDAPLSAILERAYWACNPENESQALSKYEWTKGYSRGFGLDAPSEDGTLSVQSDIDVFASADKANGKLKYDKTSLENDSRAGWGCNGLKVERIDEFPAEGVGDESHGMRVRWSLDGVRGTTTAVLVRRDRVLATVTISRINSEDSTAEAIDAARKVDEKMLKVLTAPLT
jgi:hypothetical protein